MHGLKWTRARQAELEAIVAKTEAAPSVWAFCSAVGMKIGRSAAGVRERMRKTGLKAKVLARTERPPRVYCCGTCSMSGHNARGCPLGRN